MTGSLILNHISIPLTHSPYCAFTIQLSSLPEILPWQTIVQRDKYQLKASRSDFSDPHGLFQSYLLCSCSSTTQRPKHVKLFFTLLCCLFFSLLLNVLVPSQMLHPQFLWFHTHSLRLLFLSQSQFKYSLSLSSTSFPRHAPLSCL